MTLLSRVERRILDVITRDVDVTDRELARAAGTDERDARRLYNRLFARAACRKVVLPNYALLGYRVMILQRLGISKAQVQDIPSVRRLIESRWPNCTDCYETFDGKLIVRSVWRSADEFMSARKDLMSSVDWLESEDIDMVPLDESSSIVNVRSLWSEGSQDRDGAVE